MVVFAMVADMVVIVNMRRAAVDMFVQVLVQMLVFVAMGVFMAVSLPIVGVFVVVGVAVFMAVQMFVLVFSFHGGVSFSGPNPLGVLRFFDEPIVKTLSGWLPVVNDTRPGNWAFARQDRHPSRAPRWVKTALGSPRFSAPDLFC